MMVYRQWTDRSANAIYYCWDGWFLFGFIPVYLRRYLPTNWDKRHEA